MNSGNGTSSTALSSFWKPGAGAIGFGTSRPSIFFFTGGLTRCLSIGIERPGSLTNRTTMIWAACFTTRVRHRGCAKHLALPKRCSSNSHGIQVCPSIGGPPSLSTLDISGFGETHWRHYEPRRSLWRRFFTRFPDVGKRQRIIKARRSIGLITCVKLRAVGVSSAGASPKFRI